MYNYIPLRDVGRGGNWSPPIFFWRGQSPLNILGLILRCPVGINSSPKCFVVCQPPPNIYASHMPMRYFMESRKIFVILCQETIHSTMAYR